MSRRCLSFTQSVEREGIIQPIVARRMAPGDYQIIAGERRAGAQRLLAGHSRWCRLLFARQTTKKCPRASRLYKNIQREDLNPIELAIAFERMAAELSLSHEEIGQKTGKDRATVTNSIRLLQLPAAVQQLIATKKLTSGHYAPC